MPDKPLSASIFLTRINGPADLRLKQLPGKAAVKLVITSAENSSGPEPQHRLALCFFDHQFATGTTHTSFSKSTEKLTSCRCHLAYRQLTSSILPSGLTGPGTPHSILSVNPRRLNHQRRELSVFNECLKNREE